MTLSALPLTILRGRLVSFAEPLLYLPRGQITIESGLITAVGGIAPPPPGAVVIDHGDHLIMPGFIDAHVHYPQVQVIASWGAQLIDWLNQYTFPAEAAYADAAFAARQAEFFLAELLRNGTTTAAVYCSVHPQSVEAFFNASAARNCRMIAGKVLMDRNAPENLRDDADSAYHDSADLIERWHGHGRQLYAITPRFAITSSEAQLAAAGELARAYPDAYLQTHLAENHAEIAYTRALFPHDPSYTAIYHRFGLLHRRSLLGHCIHLDDRERALLAETGAVAVFCPTSNLFLGSGLFDHDGLRADGIRTAIATDVGGGTSYSMLRTAAEGYKVLQLRGQNWPAFAALRAITSDNAEALGLGDRIGRIAPGYEADLVVIDPAATPAMAHRLDAVRANDPLEALAQELFTLITMGDDRAIRTTYVAGISQEIS